MTWLIRLYPPAWRRRYGRELADLLATQPASLGTAIDLLAGAVDAWFNPQSSTVVGVADAKGVGVMVARMLHLRCTGDGPHVTREDRRKATMVTLGGSLALAVCLVGATTWFGKTPYIESLLLLGWIVPWLVGQRYTVFKGRPGRVQAVMIGGQATFVVAVALLTAWINS